MGAGVLPTDIHNGKLVFLFGKESKYDTYNKNMYADFGGGQDYNESPLETAIREGVEETTGFLGSFETMTNYLKNCYKIIYISKDTEKKHKPYHTHIFKYNYNEFLPLYYNNNHNFLDKKLNKFLLRKSKIFEKSKIHWFSVDDLKKEKYKFKHWYRNIIDIIIKEEKQIYDFILKSNHKSSIKIKTRKNKRINKIYKKHHNTYNYRKNNI